MICPVEIASEVSAFCRIPQDTWERSHENIRFGFYTAFGGPEIVKGESVLETLNKMADAVTGIMDRFEKFLL
jgi:hypothetical protein